jgi:hypothetical protein
MKKSGKPGETMRHYIPAILTACFFVSAGLVWAEDGGEESKDTSQVSAFVQEAQEDGSRLTQVIEKQRMIRIAERPRDGISIVVVDTVRGSDKVYRYSARNENILKSKHPKGYALYEKYVKNPVDALGITETDFRKRAGAHPDEAFRKQWQQAQQQLMQNFGVQNQSSSKSSQTSGQGNGRQAFSRASSRASASAQGSSSARSSSSSSSQSLGSQSTRNRGQ